MNPDEYRSAISFRFVQPTTRLPDVFLKVSSYLGKVGVNVDVLNTRLPRTPSAVAGSLREICRIPRMSTIAVGALIHAAVARMPENQAFVNVGIWHGFTFLSGIVNNADKIAIGVDNFSEFGGPREAFLERFNRYKGPKHRFHEMDYQKYFQTIHKEPIGFYIYDGEHSYENQMKGLEIAEPFLAPGCLVLVDDTNWSAARQATLDFVAARDKKYRLVLDEKTSRAKHPTFWNGIMMFEKTA